MTTQADPRSTTPRRPARRLRRLAGGLAVVSAVYLAPVLLGVMNLSTPVDYLMNVGTFSQDPELVAENDGVRRLVVLRHGILRSAGSLWKLERALRAHGYETLNLSYPSTRGSIEDHAAMLARELEQKLEDQAQRPLELYFVGHSMGGLQIRSYLSRADARSPTACVFLGVPNQGAFLAEKLGDWLPFQLLMGTEAAHQLRPSDPFYQSLKPLDCDCGIVFGGSGDQEGFSAAIPGDDDGRVSSEEAQLPESTDQIQLRGLGHTALSFSDQAVRQVLFFLSQRHFDRAPSTRPPLLLLTLDTTRADALGCYGGELAETPHLDSLAAAGTRFTQARTVAPLTLPAHASLFSSRFPHELGVRDNAGFQLRDDVVTLAEVLLQADYDTAAVIGSTVLSASTGIGQGFRHLDDVPRRKLESAATIDRRTATEVVNAGLKFLEQRADPDRPFFLWLHFFDPHEPLDPPPDLRERFLNRSEPASASRTRRLLYQAAVAGMDREIGRLLAWTRQNLTIPPLIVAVADHGEGIGDHGEQTHGYYLYDTVIRVPWLVQHPNLPGGVTVNAPVSVVDLMPTVLDLLGLEVPDRSGTSLASWIRGQELPASTRPIYFETCYPFLHHRWSPMYGLVEDDFKLIHSTRAELFDLGEDPRETENRLNQRQALAEKMRQRLRDLAQDSSPASRRTFGAEEIEQLERLGYVGTSAGPDSDPAMQPGHANPSLRDAKDARELLNLQFQAFGLFRKRQPSQAADLMLKVLEQDPDDPSFLDHAGAYLVEAQRVAEAIPILTRALELNPDLSSPRASLASCFEKQGNLERAIELYRSNVQRDPDHLLSRFDLARLLSMRKKYEESLYHYEEFLRRYAADNKLRRQVQEQMQLIRRLQEQETGKE